MSEVWLLQLRAELVGRVIGLDDTGSMRRGS